MPRLAAALLALPFLAAPVNADTIFVNASTVLPSALQTGNSWAFAYKSLQDALAEAVDGDEIWVAKGTYKPTSGTDRSASFVVPTGARLFGGFLPGASSLDQRDPLENATVLSGEIGGPTMADNSFHVMKTLAGTSTTVIAGIVITGGNANGGGADNLGGGVRNTGSPSFVDCRFLGNSAAVTGGAVLSSTGGNAAPIQFHNCLFVGNSAGSGAGAAADIQGGPASFFFCSALHNVGGGIRYLNAGTTSQISCSIVRDNTGGGTLFQQQVLTANSTVALNASNISGIGGLGFACIDASPSFVNPSGADGTLGTLDDDFRLRGDSPCIDAGSAVHVPADQADLDGDGVISEQLPLDLGGAPRRTEDLLVANGLLATAPGPDIGAFEFQRPRTILVDIDATGSNNGTSWQNAYTSLQSALAELNDVKFGGPGEIWVAEGTYRPTATTNQAISFVLPLDGQVYGGFAGGELVRSQRDWVAHPTILSGEIGDQGSKNDNTDSVVFANGDFYDNATVLDGFIVTRGNGGVGGGIYVKTNADPTIRNCRVVDNLKGIVFEGNQNSKPILDNCIVHGNATHGVDYTFTDARITNCTVAFNTVAGFNSGAGIKGDGIDGEIRNCLVFGNVGNGVAGQAAQIGRPSGDGVIHAVISCCAIQGFTGSFPNDVNCFAIGPDGGVTDADGADNVAGTVDDDFSVPPCSDLIDAGDNVVAYADGLDYDDDGDAAESLNEDFAGGSRRVDLPVPDSGLGIGGIDIGAHERQALALPDPDLNDDGEVDGADLAILLGAWGTSSGAVDLNGDCTIGGADLAILLGAWS